MEKQRLDKFISNQLCISRSDARAGIRRGLARVSDQVVKDPSIIIDAETDEVIYSGNAIAYKKYLYILMHKPSGVLSASEDKKSQTVIDLVPSELRRPNLFPVGRLDKDTTGLLIITDDGEFAHNCIAPKKRVPKTYLVGLDGNITPEMITRFAEGVILADGTVCKGAVLESIGENIARITITEGKYHQIKRMFGTVGLGVVALHRQSIGSLVLPLELNPGECMEMTKQQLSDVFAIRECAF